MSKKMEEKVLTDRKKFTEATQKVKDTLINKKGTSEKKKKAY